MSNRGGTRISRKHQVTIPVQALRAAGLGVGERLFARSDGPGRVALERERDVRGSTRARSPACTRRASWNS